MVSRCCCRRLPAARRDTIDRSTGPRSVIGYVEQVVACLAGHSNFGEHRGTPPDRWIRLLIDRLQERRPYIGRSVLALELDRGDSPGLLDEFERLPRALCGLSFIRRPDGLELVADESAADAKIEPSLGELKSECRACSATRTGSLSVRRRTSASRMRLVRARDRTGTRNSWELARRGGRSGARRSG